MSSREEMYLEHFRADRLLRGVRKEKDRNPKSDRVRRRDWLQSDLDDPEAWDELAAPQVERVMPKGEQERRRANLQRTQVQRADAGDQDNLQPPAEAAPVTPVVPVPTPAVPPSTAIPAGIPALVRPGLRRPMAAIAAGPVAASPRPEVAAAVVRGETEGYGLVLEVSAGLCRVEFEGHILLCGLRGSLSGSGVGSGSMVAVGDRVQVTPEGHDRGIVEAVQPRRGVLARPDVLNSHIRQVIAANVDQLLVVAAYREPQFWPELVDRYLITAALNGLAPFICVNKVDLAASLAAAQASLQPYLALGYRVIFTSAISGEGLDELRAALHARTTVLAGLSGVGKSSLLSAVQPGLRLRTGEVNAHQHLGRHTTSQAVLHRLDSGGSVVDTPGIKEFGLVGLRRQDLAAYYPEILVAARQCRFADCQHLDEPGCAVRQAVRLGHMAETRYQSYRKIRDSLAD